MTTLDPTMIQEAKRLEAMIEGSINAGHIPPRPSYVNDGERWRAWFDEFVRCTGALDRGGRCYMQREMPLGMCKDCIRANRAKAKPASFGNAMSWSKLARQSETAPMPQTPPALSELAREISASDASEQPKRVRRARAF